MLQNEPGTLCVSIHDVAPETWKECEALLAAVREVADIPLTWLVVPQYRGSAARSTQLEDTLGHLLAHGHELALHGYTHVDDAAASAGLVGALVRNVVTQREGEFSALSQREAQRRIALGLDWFGERGWPVSGFVAPAWLIGRDAWKALDGFPFLYTTTLTHFHLLEQKRALFAPSLVYAARNRGGRALSPLAASTIAYLLRDAPLVRFSLHPKDARYPALVHHAQRLIERLLETRMPLTKAAFARAYQ